MKKLLLTMLASSGSFLAMACPVCEKQQPAIFRGITHGTGPDSQWDYLIVAVAALVVLITLFYSVKWLIRPGERSQNHIKNLIINAE